jgi:hypothetical protein
MSALGKREFDEISAVAILIAFPGKAQSRVGCSLARTSAPRSPEQRPFYLAISGIPHSSLKENKPFHRDKRLVS